MKHPPGLTVFARFVHAAGGIVLAIAALAVLIVSISPPAGSCSSASRSSANCSTAS